MLIDLDKIKRGTIIKRSTLKNAKGWLVIGVQKPLTHTGGSTEILIQSKKGRVMRITVEAVKDIAC